MLSRFYGDLLPAEGHFALWTKTDKHNIWFDNIDDLIDATEARVQIGSSGVYFATAAFNEQAAANGDKDARTQANVTGKKCFYLDLDAGAKKLVKHGADKVYATQSDAIADAVRVIKATRLRPTYFVSSGEGLHLYWALNAPVSETQWKPAARRLSRLFKQYGLKEDPAVTSDSARVLRPLGTIHESGAVVREVASRGPCYDFDDFVERVSNLLDDSVTLDTPTPTKSDVSGINRDVIVEGPPKSMLKILKKCEAFTHAVRVRGNVPEPYWRAMLGIIKHTVEGDTAAHAFSSGHPEYDRRDTQFKLDNWKTGPTTCAEFSKHSSACATCPHRGTIKSPITLGYMTDREVESLPEPAKPTPPTPEATGNPWDGCIPDGFYVESKGSKHTLVYRMPVEREDPESGDKITVHLMVPFTTTLFWYGEWSDAEHSDDTAQVFLCKWTGHSVKHYTLDQTLIANQQKLREFLASKSIIVSSHPKAVKAMEEYSKALLEAVKQKSEMPKISKRLGMFITSEGELQCAHGGYIISGDGTIRRGILSSELRQIAPAFTIPLPASAKSVWGSEVWDTHIRPAAEKHVAFLRKYYNKPGLEKFQLAAMMGLASPLMAFVTGEYLTGKVLPPNGLTVSLFSSEGGRGKTTLLKAIMLAYGMPQGMTSDKNRTGATDNSRIARASIMGTMPMGMDEMGENAAATCASIVSAIANGSGRERATKDGGLNLASPFALINIMAANKSARDMIAAANSESSAIQYRLLELDVDNIAEFSVEERSAFGAEWAEITPCAGALGAIIHRTLCGIGVHGVNALVMKAVNKASTMIESGQTDRFQYRGLGATLALCTILHSIGLDIFDIPTLVAEFKRAHQLGHSYAVENTLPSDGLSLLSMMLHDLSEHTAITMNETRRSRHVTTYDEPLVPVPSVVHARHIVSTRTTYISTTAIRDWCAKHKISINKIISAAKAAGVLGAVYASRGEGNSGGFNLMMGMRGNTEARVSCYAVRVGVLATATGKDLVPEVQQSDNVIPLNPPAPENPSKDNGEPDAVNQ